jgi:hypothetical protein
MNVTVALEHRASPSTAADYLSTERELLRAHTRVKWSKTGLSSVPEASPRPRRRYDDHGKDYLALRVHLHGDARVWDELALRLGQRFEGAEVRRRSQGLLPEGEVDAGHDRKLPLNGRSVNRRVRQAYACVGVPMVWSVVLGMTIFAAISGFVAWVTRTATSAVSTYAEIKEDVDRSKRERASAQTKTATELWSAHDARTAAASATEVRLASGHAIHVAGARVLQSEQDARAYLIAKHGDNIDAYDAWRKASNGRGDELTVLFAEVFEWKKKQKGDPGSTS